ncbi:MAG TPA: hypothetical protein VMS87_04475, partial [Roseiarcus sp.]|nr:hypothetical protein [Roseiarcus sp.]
MLLALALAIFALHGVDRSGERFDMAHSWTVLSLRPSSGRLGALTPFGRGRPHHHFCPLIELFIGLRRHFDATVLPTRHSRRR